jgi:hypothetical protein
MPGCHTSQGIKIPKSNIVMKPIKEQPMCTLVHSKIHTKQYDFAEECTKGVTDGRTARSCMRFRLSRKMNRHAKECAEEFKPVGWGAKEMEDGDGGFVLLFVEEDNVM